MTYALVDPIYHITGIRKAEDFEAYHLRLGAALLDYQKRIDQGAQLVILDKWDAESGSTYTRVRHYDRESGANIDRPAAAA